MLSLKQPQNTHRKNSVTPTSEEETEAQEVKTCLRSDSAAQQKVHSSPGAEACPDPSAPPLRWDIPEPMDKKLPLLPHPQAAPAESRPQGRVPAPAEGSALLRGVSAAAPEE